MKRSDFLKKLGIGLGVAVVAPQVIANNIATRDEWNFIPQKTPLPAKEPRGNVSIYEGDKKLVEVCLFFQGKELSPKQYTRQTVPFAFKVNGDRLMYDIKNLTFPIKGSARIDEIKLIEKDGNDMGAVWFVEDYTVVNGNFNIVWDGYFS